MKPDRFTGTLEYHLTQDYNQRGDLEWEEDRLANLRIAIREIVANAKDGKTFWDWETGEDSPLEIGVANIQRIGPIFRAFNRGQIDDRALLMGWSNKRSMDVQGIIGQFGEGLKLAMITACRLGISMVIRVGDVEWKPSLEESTKFKGETVLFVRSKKLDIERHVDGTEVRLYPIKPEIWETEKPKYRFLNPQGKTINTPTGILLLDPKETGKIYVNGILDHVQEDFIFGYDLTKVPREEINRDRRLIATHILKQHTTDILIQAIHLDKEGVVSLQLTKMMSGPNYKNVEGGYLSWESQRSLQTISETFRRLNPNVIPISDPEKIERVKSAGLQPLVVSSSLISVLSKAEGEKFVGIEEVERLIADYYTDEMSWDSFTGEELYNINKCLSLLERVSPDLNRNRFKFVNFSTTKNGLYKGDTGEIYISKKILLQPTALFEAMVHEWAHREGTDGSVAFEKELGKLHSKITLSQIKW